MNQEVKTAAGQITVISTGRAATRGNATMFFGTLPDGRYVVTSRFQYELRTGDRAKAEQKFKELCNG